MNTPTWQKCPASLTHHGPTAPVDAEDADSTGACHLLPSAPALLTKAYGLASFQINQPIRISYL